MFVATFQLENGSYALECFSIWVYFRHIPIFRLEGRATGQMLYLHKK